ncbi:CubicO group peptidase (beta-lactamase class C family) [Sphingomonas sp. BE270]|jgi:CubicO group peptidase (beta-lactamase class C family)|uniref:serine hydrolase domain-containing protein n=1 Tax=unclassified Sphingomonas TaxID=196159 RepID=UPI0010F6CBC7|nr:MULTISPECIES: serine hydrolase domain-containing protein [unclassified Sphingomonas]MDR6846884.1 CubicO group peptidase (beta-lactamase class C family) [Sphingomonas sp. BE137]MDR7256562.1 CubicO group peptidase (beta-lactamase class C family) [Sphingomonas sp. BE270]
MVATRFKMAASALLIAATGTAVARHVVHAPVVLRTAPRLPQTQAVFSGYVAAKKIPGVVGVIGRGNAPFAVVAAGRIGDEPGAPLADKDSLWRVYSMTKPITAMAAMILIEEGKMRLDQPVSDFIPAFKTMRVQVSPDSLDTRAATRPITIRNLLTHTAGLGYTIITKGPLLKAYEDAGITPFTSDAKTEAQLRLKRPPTLEAFANKVATLPLIAEPGTKWSYSIGLDVMGRVIEVASHQPFDRFLQTRIFTPLKMRSSWFTVPGSEAHRLATGYFITPNGRTPVDPGATSVYLKAPSFPYGGAGLVTSAYDYDRFLHMLQNGGTLDGVRILKPATVKLAMSNLLPNGVVYPGAVAATGGTTNPQGFGAGGSVTLHDTPGGPAKGTYGWGGAAGTIAWVDPVNQFRATIMVNYLPGDRWPLRADSTKAVYADLAPVLPHK